MKLSLVDYPTALKSANFLETPHILEKKYEGMREAEKHLLVSYNENLVDLAIGIANTPVVYFNAFKFVLEAVVRDKIESIPKFEAKNFTYIGYLITPSELKVVNLPDYNEEEMVEFTNRLHSIGIATINNN